MNTRSYPVILTENFFTLIGDKDYSITKSDSRFAQAIALYKARNWDALLNLLDRPAAIARYSHGNVIVYDGVITFKGQEVHNAVADRILTFFKEGLPYEPLVAFMNNLFDNTSEGVRAKLYQFLERNNLGITEDGNVVVYKMVTEDGAPPYHSGSAFYKELEDGKTEEVFTYNVGNTYILPREQIHEGGECNGPGLHVGNKTYWGNDFDKSNTYTGSGRLLIAEVRPQDVCNVSSADSTKMVVCRLKLIGEYKTLKPLVDRALVLDDEPQVSGGEPDEREPLTDEGDAEIICAINAARQTTGVTQAEKDRLLDMVEADAKLARKPKSRSKYGIRPLGGEQGGRRYYNVRKGGKFAKQKPRSKRPRR